MARNPIDNVDRSHLPANNIDSNFGDILGLLTNGSDDSIDKLLHALGIQQEQGLSGSQRDDWNKQLLDILTQYRLTQENRTYNESLRDEQRIYDSPTNQLARLMAAGISRDAALQLLSGSGSSGGSSAPYSDAAQVVPGIAPSQSELNGIQAKLAIPSTLFGAIGTISGAIGALGSFGISAASLSTNLAATRAATAGQLLNNSSFSKTMQGIETASTVIGAISQAVDAGVISKDKEFSSAQDMIKTIRDKSNEFEPFKQMVDSGTLDSIGKDLYSLQALNSGYKSWRESRDYGIDRKHIVAMQSLERMFNAIEIDRVQSEITENYAEIGQIISDVINSTNLANKNIELMSSQIVKNFAESSNIDAQTDLLYQQYDLQQMDLDWLNANINDINSVRTNQLMLDAARWQSLTSDPAAFNAEVESWLSDRANLRTAIALESYYYSGRLAAVDARQNSWSKYHPFSDVALANTATWLQYRDEVK